MREVTAALCIGLLLDYWIGDPEWLWHPVRGIGWLIGQLEQGLRHIFPRTSRGELAAGALLAVLVTGITVMVSAGILQLAGRLHPWARFALMCLMCGQILAAKSLKTESMKVYDALKKEDLPGARYAVSRIVGRDTEELSPEGVAKAAVETVAENCSDGVIAPMFWMLLFGAVGGFFYKAVNTMDSMVGYQNERYLYFGRAAARLDDLVNWIPARLTGALFVAAAWLLPGYDGRGAFRIWRRDRRKHKSPNSAQSESACAGALGIQLAGDASYFGVVHKKPFIGDGLRTAEPEDIVRANRLMYAAAMLAAGIWILAAAAWMSI